MAYANWVKVTPPSGSGDGKVNVSSVTENTGRDYRETKLTWKGANVSNVERYVRQAGKPEYVDIADSAAAQKEGADVTIKGESNSRILTFSLGDTPNGNTELLDIDLPNTYTANGVTVNNGSAITGDPGKTSKYEFSITIYVDKNTSIGEKTRQIIVTNEAGNSDACWLVSAAGDAYVRLDSTDPIELGYEAGSSKEIQVYSNTNWTIE